MASLSEDLDSLVICKKEERLIQAIYENNVELLKVLLDSPELYKITDKRGKNLLQISVVEEKKEVFDYLLSLPDYPLEFKNPEDITLELALDYPWTEEKEYFACELIEKGACIDKICDKGDTLLHYACKRGFVKASMLLIEKGIDVNACGYKNFTPLQMICKSYYSNSHTKQDECIFMLLEFGADPSVRKDNRRIPFEDSVIHNYPNEVQEALFYYTFDEFSSLEIHLNILLKLATKNSPLFYEIIKHQFEIIVETNVSTVNSYLKSLNSIKTTNLTTLITKYERSFKILFGELSEENFGTHIGTLSIEKLNILIETSLKNEIINNFVPLACSYLYYQIGYYHNESELSEYICFLLSYGMELDEKCLHLIYRKFGYCDLFKILLHMDIKTETDLYCFSSIFPNLLIHVTKDFLTNNNNIRSYQLKELMCYFAHAKLHSMYREAISKETFSRETISEKSISIPKVPSLVELSRNVFRSYFINQFQIKTSRTFYTLLNCLKISPVYKKIITYETKLYAP